ncbi:MAG: hypothetical protein RM338_19550 [Nostoc sp. DedQUE12a]|nr:hypothetical protein [Nostoc sp. DedQUE12a]
MAGRSLPGARGVLFLPHFSGERSPHLDLDTRGAFVNLSLAHTQADVISCSGEDLSLGLTRKGTRGRGKILIISDYPNLI